MKRKHLFFICLASAFILTACNTDTKEIQKCAQGYLDAMGNYKPTEARQYSTQETCDSTLAFFEQVMKHTDPSAYANNMPAEITLGEVKIMDSIAEVPFHKHTPSQEQDGTVHLLKRDGKWQVNEVIKVPPSLREAMNQNPNDTTPHPREFTKEQLQRMHEKGPQNGPIPQQNEKQ